MRFSTILTSLLVMVPSVATADIALGDLREPRTAGHYEMVTTRPTPDHIRFVRQLLPPVPEQNLAAVANSRLVYLNRKGVTLTPGQNDSRINRSSIVNSTRSVPAWNTSEQVWNATVACMKNMFSRFDVSFTEVDPGNVPHIEAVFGGSPQAIGLPSGVGGVSPFTSNCGVIENSIVFTFTSVFPNNAQTICEVMAQEVAHSYGLDHEMLASDPMTYLNFNGARSFKDQAASCGEYQNRPCGIGGSTCRPNQNSVQLLRQRLGDADLVPPTLDITSPADGAMVPPGFAVEVTAQDNLGVKLAMIYIDDVPAGTIEGAGPFTFATDGALADGAHVVRVEVTDGKHVESETIAVTIARTMPPGGGGGSGGGEDSGGGGGGGEGGADTGSDGGCSTTSGGGGLALAFGLALLGRRRRR